MADDSLGSLRDQGSRCEDSKASHCGLTVSDLKPSFPGIICIWMKVMMQQPCMWYLQLVRGTSRLWDMGLAEELATREGSGGSKSVKADRTSLLSAHSGFDGQRWWSSPGYRLSSGPCRWRRDSKEPPRFPRSTYVSIKISARPLARWFGMQVCV